MRSKHVKTCEKFVNLSEDFFRTELKISDNTRLTQFKNLQSRIRCVNSDQNQTNLLLSSSFSLFSSNSSTSKGSSSCCNIYSDEVNNQKSGKYYIYLFFTNIYIYIIFFVTLFRSSNMKIELFRKWAWLSFLKWI